MLARIRTRLTSRIGRLTGARVIRRLASQESGAATVEFALVAAPFLALVFAILETAIVFFAGQVLETAVADSSRLIMTGQAQTAGWSASQFKTQVCSKIYGLFDCANGLTIDVQKFTSFSNIAVGSPVNSDGTFKSTQFSTGTAGDIVVVRLMYQWPVYVSLLGFNLSNNANGKRLLIATAAFRNEPYQ